MLISVYRSLMLMLLLLTACALNTPTPAPTPQSPTEAPNITLALPALLAAPQQWSGQALTVVAPLAADGAGRVLAMPGTGGSSQGIWLAQPLTADVLGQIDTGGGFLKLHGVLSPPGAYGTDQRFPYQFSADQVVVATPERTRIDNLALNPNALDLILLRLDGTLLARPDSALLVDQVTESGVPRANGQQIKLAGAIVDQALTAKLRVSGDVRWGAVAVVGWWQGGSLTPLAITEPSVERSAAPLAPSATAEPSR